MLIYFIIRGEDGLWLMRGIAKVLPFNNQNEYTYSLAQLVILTTTRLTHFLKDFCFETLPQRFVGPYSIHTKLYNMQYHCTCIGEW